MTTNGVLLPTLRPTFEEQGWSNYGEPGHASRDRFEKLRVRRAAQVSPDRRRAHGGFAGLKIDAVITRATTTRARRLIEFGRDVDAEVRFIEYMTWARHALASGGLLTPARCSTGSRPTTDG